MMSKAAQFHFWEYIHKWEPDIYIGFSTAPHLWCGPEIYPDDLQDCNVCSLCCWPALISASKSRALDWYLPKMSSAVPPQTKGIRFEITGQSVFTWNKIIVNRFENRHSIIIFFKKYFVRTFRRKNPALALRVSVEDIQDIRSPGTWHDIRYRYIQWSWPEVEFLDINFKKDSSFSLHPIHSPFYCRF